MCAFLPVSQSACLGLDDAEVPEGGVSPCISLSVSIYLDGNRPFSKVFDEILCY